LRAALPASIYPAVRSHARLCAIEFFGLLLPLPALLSQYLNELLIFILKRGMVCVAVGFIFQHLRRPQTEFPIEFRCRPHLLVPRGIRMPVGA